MNKDGLFTWLIRIFFSLINLVVALAFVKLERSIIHIMMIYLLINLCMILMPCGNALSTTLGFLRMVNVES